MKFYNCILLLSLVLCVSAQGWFSDAGSFIRDAYRGAGDMWRAYSDMREANYKHADKYFHARGNYDAAQRGPGVTPEKVGRMALVAEERKTHVKTRRQMHGAEVEETPTATDQTASHRNINAICHTSQWFLFLPAEQDHNK